MSENNDLNKNFVYKFKYDDTKFGGFLVFGGSPKPLGEQIEDCRKSQNPKQEKNMVNLKLIFDRISDEESGVPKEAIDENFIKYLAGFENLDCKFLIDKLPLFSGIKQDLLGQILNLFKGNNELELILKTFVDMDLSINDKVFKTVSDFCHNNLKLSDIETNKLLFDFSVTDNEKRQKFLRFDKAVVNSIIEDEKYLKNPAMANSVFRHGRVIASYFIGREYDKLLSVMNECLGQQGSNSGLKNIYKEIFNSYNYRELSDEIISFVFDTSLKIKDTFNAIIESIGKESKAVQQIEKILGTKEIGNYPAFEINAIKDRVKDLENGELNFSTVANLARSSYNVLIFDKIKDNQELKSVNDKFMQTIINEFLPGFTPADANKENFSYTDYVKSFIDDMVDMLESYDKKLIEAGKDGLKITLKLKPKFGLETNLKNHIPDFIYYALENLADKYRFEDIKNIAKASMRKILPIVIPELKELDDFSFIDEFIDSQIKDYEDLKTILETFLPSMSDKKQNKDDKNKNDSPFGKYSDDLIKIIKSAAINYIKDDIADGKLNEGEINNIKSLLTNGLSLLKEISKDKNDENKIGQIIDHAKNSYSKAREMFIKGETLEILNSILIKILGDKDVHEYVFDLIKQKEKPGMSEEDKKILRDENARLKKVFEGVIPDISDFMVVYVKNSEDPIRNILDNAVPILQKAKALSNELKKSDENENDKTDKDKTEPIGSVIEKAKALYSEVKKLSFISGNQENYKDLLIKLVKNKSLHSYMFEQLKPSIDKLSGKQEDKSKIIDFAKGIFDKISFKEVDLLEKYIKSVGQDKDPIEIALESDILNKVANFHDQILLNNQKNTTDMLNGLKDLFKSIEEEINKFGKGELKKAYEDLLVTVLDQINSENIDFVINNFVSEETRSSVTPVTTLVGKWVFKQAINNIKANIGKSDMPMTELLNDIPDTSKKNVGLVLSSINSFNKTFKNKVVRSFIYVAEVIVVVPLAAVLGFDFVFNFIKSKVASKPLDKVKETQDKQFKQDKKKDLDDHQMPI